MNTLYETTINMVAEGTRIEGEVLFDHISKVNGTLVGRIKAKDGSTLILSEIGMIEGSIEADTFIIDGFVQGEINAKTRVVISRTGRVNGNIKTPSLTLEFGAYFEGRCSMQVNAPLT
jgi:cytoskeletal protein CcmA (bactofilin family)